MDQATTYALLAAAAYQDARIEDENRAPIPQGWQVLPEFSRDGSGASASLTGTGFTARVFRGPAGEIVISYAGTEFGGSTVGPTGRITASDLAAGVYVNGHSLGGFLAATFTRLFGTQANVLQTSTFNSAGFAIGSGPLLAPNQASWRSRPCNAKRSDGAANGDAWRFTA